MTIITSDLIKKAETHLALVEPKFIPLIHEFGPCTLLDIKYEPFVALISAVVSQQISTKAANSIKKKLFDALGEPVSHWHIEILRYTSSELQQFGLSATKANCLATVAKAINSDELDFNKIILLDDEQIITDLTTFKGIGRWTVEMFLIFGLLRPNVLSLGDGGLPRGVQRLYGMNEKPNQSDMVTIFDAWQPYRTIASWYLWRVIG